MFLAILLQNKVQSTGKLAVYVQRWFVRVEEEMIRVDVFYATKDHLTSALHRLNLNEKLLCARKKRHDMLKENICTFWTLSDDHGVQTPYKMRFNWI